MLMRSSKRATEVVIKEATSHRNVRRCRARARKRLNGEGGRGRSSLDLAAAESLHCHHGSTPPQQSSPAMGWSNKGGKGGYNGAMAFMMPQGYEQAMQQQMMQPYPYQNMQMGYQGKGWGKTTKGKGKGADPNGSPNFECPGCGGSCWPRHSCPYNYHVCTHCNQTGHNEDVCRQAKSVCKCCGEKGHSKVNCPLKDEACTNCKKTGHQAAVCRGSAAKATSNSQDTPKEAAPSTSTGAQDLWVCSDPSCTLFNTMNSNV